VQLNIKQSRKFKKSALISFIKGRGTTDFIRFMQQFNQGYGNYVEDRHQWQKSYSVNDILAEIEKS
jgi:hypothetical protein